MSSTACRTGAALALGSAVLHGFSVGDGHHVALVVLTVAMAVACLLCAADLWTRGSERAWVLVAVMNLAMIGVHLPMAAHHHGGAVAAVGPTSNAMTAATLLAVIEVALATVVLAVRSRRYAPRLPDPT